MADKSQPDYDKTGEDGEVKVKVICLGDSAVGKSKLVERFLMDGYQPQQLSTFALTLFNYNTEVNDQKVSVVLGHTRHGFNPFSDRELEWFPRFIVLGALVMLETVDFWDTAGQERFSNMHPSYYHQAHACILVFDSSRKVTYKNLPNWLKELREYRPEIPCLCAANKIDVDYSVTKKTFHFAKKHNMPFYFVSASDGTNVVKLFRDAIKSAVIYKQNPTDFMDEIMRELENFDLDTESADGVSERVQEDVSSTDQAPDTPGTSS